MERKTLMRALAEKAFEHRIGLSELCAKAGISRTVATRWQNDEDVTPLLPTIGRLERKLDEIINKERGK